MLEYWNELQPTIKLAKELAALRPGRYGGRYVARRYSAKCNADYFVVLPDDDPEKTDEGVDILCQVTPTKVLPIGRMRHLMDEDGNVDLSK